LNIVNLVVRQGILWIVATILFLTLLFLPRTTVYTEGRGGSFESARYEYSLKDHVQQFKDFYTYIKVNKGLGEVMDGHSATVHVVRTFTKSMKIALPALAIGLFAGIAKGVFDYRFRNKKTRFLGEPTTRVFLSIPDLFLIIMIQIAIMTAYEWGIMPYMKVYGSDSMSVLFLNIFFLSIYPIFYIANITYSSIRDEQGRDYIVTAFSKGTPSLKVLYSHVLKNCYPKILSHTNTITLYTLSNLFIVEYLTNYRGAALFFYETVASPAMIGIGQQNPINLFGAAGYIILFTGVIFLAKLAAGIGKNMVSPLERS
jgi:oligopeptide transport system permease protein